MGPGSANRQRSAYRPPVPASTEYVNQPPESDEGGGGPADLQDLVLAKVTPELVEHGIVDRLVIQREQLREAGRRLLRVRQPLRRFGSANRADRVLLEALLPRRGSAVVHSNA